MFENSPRENLFRVETCSAEIFENLSTGGAWELTLENGFENFLVPQRFTGMMSEGFCLLLLLYYFFILTLDY